MNLVLRKKIAVVMTAGFVLIATLPSRNRVYKDDYSINHNYSITNPNIPFARYQNRDIYIGSRSYIDVAKRNGNIDDIYIVDQRYDEDPNIHVDDSYTINNKNDMHAIIEIIKDYEELYPSTWNRSTGSMMNEWQVHNICSYLYILPSRSDEVDFNNGDSEFYESKILSKILGN